MKKLNFPLIAIIGISLLLFSNLSTAQTLTPIKCTKELCIEGKAYDVDPETGKKCYCDSICKEKGDCCSDFDYQTVCGVTVAPAPTPSLCDVAPYLSECQPTPTPTLTPIPTPPCIYPVDSGCPPPIPLPTGAVDCTAACGYESFGGGFYTAMCWTFSENTKTFNTPAGTKTWQHNSTGDQSCTNYWGSGSKCFCLSSAAAPTPIASCVECVVTKKDILENYKKWGWDTSKSKWNDIYSNWCGKVDPTGCNDLKSSLCKTECAATTPTLYTSCTKCIINTRKEAKADILPFYKSNGWDTSESNWNKIVANWCTIDSKSCNSIKADKCKTDCTASSTTPQSCVKCILEKGGGGQILVKYKEWGWDTSQSKWDDIVKNWCGIDPSGCNKVKTTDCSKECK